MLGTPSLVRDDRIQVEKRCLEVLCFDENFANPARVCNQRRERREKDSTRKMLCGVFALAPFHANNFIFVILPFFHGRSGVCFAFSHNSV